jgi:hypothetical protein
MPLLLTVDDAARAGDLTARRPKELLHGIEGRHAIRLRRRPAAQESVS